MSTTDWSGTEYWFSKNRPFRWKRTVKKHLLRILSFWGHQHLIIGYCGIDPNWQHKTGTYLSRSLFSWNWQDVEILAPCCVSNQLNLSLQCAIEKFSRHRGPKADRAQAINCILAMLSYHVARFDESGTQMQYVSSGYQGCETFMQQIIRCLQHQDDRSFNQIKKAICEATTRQKRYRSELLETVASALLITIHQKPLLVIVRDYLLMVP
jgi:hypothetical protein